MTGEVTSLLNKPDGGDSRVRADLFKNLYSTRSALAAQAGVLVVAYAIYHAVFTHDLILFSGHPIANVLGVALFSQALLLVQPSPPLSAAHKASQGHIHGLLQTAAALAFTVGTSVIIYNKHAHAAEHFTSWHSWFGLATYGSLIATYWVGVAQYWLPEQVFGSVARAKSVYKYHRLAGYAVLVLTGATITLATDSDYNHNVLGIHPWVIAVGFALVVGGVFSQIKKSKIKFWK